MAMDGIRPKSLPPCLSAVWIYSVNGVAVDIAVFIRIPRRETERVSVQPTTIGGAIPAVVIVDESGEGIDMTSPKAGPVGERWIRFARDLPKSLGHDVVDGSAVVVDDVSWGV